MGHVANQEARWQKHRGEFNIQKTKPLPWYTRKPGGCRKHLFVVLPPLFFSLLAIFIWTQIWSGEISQDFLSNIHMFVSKIDCVLSLACVGTPLTVGSNQLYPWYLIVVCGVSGFKIQPTFFKISQCEPGITEFVTYSKSSSVLTASFILLWQSQLENYTSLRANTSV